MKTKQTAYESNLGQDGKVRRKHYVDSKELEEWWTGWSITGCPLAWSELSERIQKICEGVAIMFNPRKENDEYDEHVHDAFTVVMEKIRTGKLKFTPGRAPVFNLVTTTIFRILYSKCNKQKRQREYSKKYTEEFLVKHAPDLLNRTDAKCVQEELAHY